MRLMLAILVKQDINCLLLDEPTNHIDIKTREILEDAVSHFEGTLLFISHDRYFLESSAERIIEIYNQNLLSYEGNYPFYLEKRALRHQQVDNAIEYSHSHKASDGSAAIKLPNSSKNSEQREASQKSVASSQKKTQDEKKRPNKVTLEHYETAIQEKENEIKSTRLAQASVMNDYVALQAYEETLKQLETELEQLMETYFAFLA